LRVWTETFDTYQVVYDWTTDNDTLKIHHTDTTLNASYAAEFLPAVTSTSWETYRVSYSWAWTTTDADTFVTWFNDSMTNTDMVDTSPVYFSTWSWNEVKISMNSSANETKVFELSNFIVAIRTEVLTSWELSNSPVWTKRLLVFSDWDWDRLYCGNILGDPTAIKYSALNQVKDLWEVPFQTWTSSNVPLLRTDAWGFTNSNLWELKDLWIQVDPLNNSKWEVLWLFENWKKLFHIQINTIEESWVAIQVQKIVSNERQDFWWERNPLSTQVWTFYTNEAWVWQMVWMWSESNISEILGTTFVASIDWTNCDIVHDTKRGNILITCGLKTTWYNDLILVYNLRNKSWYKYTWWNLERFLKDWNTIYGTSSTKTQVLELFSWTDDDWATIATEFKFEAPLWLDTIYTLEDFLIKWIFAWDSFEIKIDTYDEYWTLVSWHLRLVANLQELNKFVTLIAKLTRLVITIKCNTTAQHTINYILASTKRISDNTFNKSFTDITYITDEDWNILTDEDWTKIIL